MPQPNKDGRGIVFVSAASKAPAFFWRSIPILANPTRSTGRLGGRIGRRDDRLPFWTIFRWWGQ
jgi:hypothetical protein